MNPDRQRKPPAGEFGRWLDGMLQSRRMTQADLARDMGIDQSQVSKWVRGGRLPDVPNCEKIARVFTLVEHEVVAMTGRVPKHYRVPVAHPVRERAHVLIDAMDPEVIAEFLPIMERCHTQLATDTFPEIPG